MAGWVGGLKYPVLIPAKSFASLSCSSILACLHWSVSLGAGTMWTFHARTANSSALNLLFSSASAQHKYSFKIIWSLFQMTRSFPVQSGETRCPLTQMMFWYFAHSRKLCSVGFFLSGCLSLGCSLLPLKSFGMSENTRVGPSRMSEYPTSGGRWMCLQSVRCKKGGRGQTWRRCKDTGWWWWQSYRPVC